MGFRRSSRQRKPKAAKQRAAEAQASNGGGGRGTALRQARRRSIRFVLLLGAFMICFSVVFYIWVVPSRAFNRYLDLNASWSGAIVNAFGDDVHVTGQTISSGGFSMSVKQGCEAGQVGAYFVFAVLLWPGRARRWCRWVALPCGLAILFLMNLVRIVSLYYAGVYFPSAFEMMHVDVWQPVFIGLALALWLIWIRWAASVAGAESRAA